MAFFLSPTGNSQLFDANGNPLSGGKIHTYLAGSSTAAATYKSITGAVTQENPIPLNPLGLPDSPIWLTGSVAMKFVIKDSGGVTLLTVDNISGVNDTSLSQAEWVGSGIVPTFVNATTFTMAGDQTLAFHTGRKVRVKVTAGVLYGLITSAVYTTLTTVTVVMDSGILDAGLSLVDLSILSSTQSALPLLVPIIPKDAAFTVVAADRRRMFDATGTWTMALTAAAALGSGFTFSVRNSGVGVITIDPDGAELVDGFVTVALLPGDSCSVTCNAAAFKTTGLARTETTRLPTVNVVMSADTLVVSAIGHRLDFRSATLASGTPSAISAAPANLVIPAGATLGGADGVARYIDILEMNVAGVVEFAVANTVAGGRRAEQGLLTTVAIDAASDSATVFYSATARTDVPYRVVKRCLAINLTDKWKDPTLLIDITPMSAPRRMVQNLNITTGALATGTTIIPGDDTIPQITEGDKYMELAITPTNVLSILEVTVSIFTSSNVNNRHACALFRDAVADAVASWGFEFRVADYALSATYSARVLAGSLATTVFSVRAGAVLANTTTFNGVGAARFLGGSMASSITIKEYLP